MSKYGTAQRRYTKNAVGKIEGFNLVSYNREHKGRWMSKLTDRDANVPLSSLRDGPLDRTLRIPGHSE